MRHALIVILALFCLGADDGGQVTDAAKHEAIEAAKAVAARDPQVYALTTQQCEGELHYHRSGRLILVRSAQRPSVYRIITQDQSIGRIVIGQDGLSWVLLNPAIAYAATIRAEEAGSLTVEIFDPNSGYFEAYRATNESVIPVSAQRYQQYMVEIEASTAYFDVIGASLAEDLDSQEQP